MHQKAADGHPMPTNGSKHIVGSDLLGQIDALKKNYPSLYECLDGDRVSSWQRDVGLLAHQDDDFGPDASGGRGTHYLLAQKTNMMARVGGIKQLLEFMTTKHDVRKNVVLDLLGGDGLVCKVAARLGLSSIEILSCDISANMVSAAWATGAPAILQRAERLLCKDASVNGVLLAYGTHHIDPSNRLTVVREAHRVLRPGGVFVLHDFEVGGPMDEWFRQVVDRYSVTGHSYQHFTRDEIRQYVTDIGFSDFRIVDMKDSYRSVGETADDAELAMGQYLLDMYGLVKIEKEMGKEEAARWTLDRARQIFGRTMAVTEPLYIKAQGSWCMEIPRVALVGVAIRPTDEK